MKVAAVQIGASDDKIRNSEKAVRMVKRAIRQKAKLICLPEVFNFRGLLRSVSARRHVSENIPGTSLFPLQQLARQHKIYILAGSIYEKIPGSAKMYNTSCLIGLTGKIIAKYRKINLFNAVVDDKRLRESNFFKSGRKLAAARIENFKAGLSICYDIRFSSLYNAYAKRGAGILFIPSAFTQKTGEAHWKVLVRARAIENFTFVIAPNQIGIDKRGIKYFGHSLIVDPWGRVLAEASGNKEEIVYADIHKKAIEKVKKILPSLNN